MKTIAHIGIIAMIMVFMVGFVNSNNAAAQDSTKITISQDSTKITISVNGVSFNMVKVKAGSFDMGCTEEQDGECEDSESPCHRVTITQDYYIGVYEVSKRLYKAVTGVYPNVGMCYECPVISMSWNSAMEFCAKLSQITGLRFTLPTEAEWEYAARGGHKATATKYSGSSIVGEVAWYSENSGNEEQRVGLKRPNELGIYDMSGNIWEWCLDWYGEYSNAIQTDPVGPSTGVYRVLRGGSWHYGAKGCRVAYREYGDPYDGYYLDGFRVVLHPSTNQNDVKKAKPNEGSTKKAATTEQNDSEDAIRKKRAQLLSQGYVDLGLPSGTLWKDRNEVGDSLGFYNWDEAVDKFGRENLPTAVQFDELKYHCKWTWIGNGFKVTGPNGNFIILPAAGYGVGYGRSGKWFDPDEWKDYRKIYYGKNGRYWSCARSIHPIYLEFVHNSRSSNNERPYVIVIVGSDYQRYSVRLVYNPSNKDVKTHKIENVNYWVPSPGY